MFYIRERNRYLVSISMIPVILFRKNDTEDTVGCHMSEMLSFGLFYDHMFSSFPEFGRRLIISDWSVISLKKLISVFTSIALVACLMSSAYAATYKNLSVAHDEWNSTGYPDWVAAVYEGSDDDDEDEDDEEEIDTDEAFVLVTSDEGEEELLESIKNNTSFSVYVDEEAISYNELIEIYTSVLGEYYSVDNEDTPVVGVAIDWLTDEDGDIVGFGSTGLECRVIVSVEADSLEEYESLLEEEYGDAVYVIEGEAEDDEDDEDDESDEDESDEDESDEDEDEDEDSSMTLFDWIFTIGILAVILIAYIIVKRTN